MLLGDPVSRPSGLQRKKTKPPTVAGILRELAREGFTATKQAETQHGVVDHLVFGPTGVFTVVPTTWRRHVWAASRPARVMVGRLDVTDTVRQIVRQAIELERRARREWPSVEVRALIVVTATRLPAGPLALGRATVVDVDQLAGELTRGERSLDDGTIRRVAETLTDPSNVVAVSSGSD